MTLMYMYRSTLLVVTIVTDYLSLWLSTVATARFRSPMPVFQTNCWMRHVCTSPASFLQSFEHSPFQALLSRLSVAPVKWLLSVYRTLWSRFDYRLCLQCRWYSKIGKQLVSSSNTAESRKWFASITKWFCQREQSEQPNYCCYLASGLRLSFKRSRSFIHRLYTHVRLLKDKLYGTSQNAWFGILDTNSGYLRNDDSVDISHAEKCHPRLHGVQSNKCAMTSTENCQTATQTHLSCKSTHKKMINFVPIGLQSHRMSAHWNCLHRWQLTSKIKFFLSRNTRMTLSIRNESSIGNF